MKDMNSEKLGWVVAAILFFALVSCVWFCSTNETVKYVETETVRIVEVPVVYTATNTIELVREVGVPVTPETSIEWMEKYQTWVIAQVPAKHWRGLNTDEYFDQVSDRVVEIVVAAGEKYFDGNTMITQGQFRNLGFIFIQDKYDTDWTGTTVSVLVAYDEHTKQFEYVGQQVFEPVVRLRESATATSVPVKPATDDSKVISTPTPEPTAVPPVCDCSYNRYNCSAFPTHVAAQECYLYCKSQGRGDVHQLDGDSDGSACEWNP